MLTACLGLAAVVRPLPIGRRVRQYAALSAVAGGFALLALVGGRVGRVEGALLVVAYGALVGFVWWREKEPPRIGEAAEERGDGAGRRPAVALLLCLVGLALMLGGGDLAVRGAVDIVEALGRTDSAVGLTVLALATSAELFALVLTAARHDVAEVAAAGVVGSAAFNATATLGTAALVRPLEVSSLTAPAATAAVLPLVVLALAGARSAARLGRGAGLLLCAGYAAYVVLLLA